MPESNYINAIAAYRDSLVAALEIADDPFKAPEIVVMTSKDVMAAAWNMQTEYAAMMRGAPKEMPAHTTLLEIRKILSVRHSIPKLERIIGVVNRFFGEHDPQ